MQLHHYQNVHQLLPVQHMNREDIIKLAREAGFSMHDGIITGGVTDLERFAALVAASEREQIIAKNAPVIEQINAHIKTLEDAVAAEREACAKVCEEKQEYSMPIPCPDGISGCLVAHYIPARREKTGSECAAAIRARGQA